MAPTVETETAPTPTDPVPTAGSGHAAWSGPPPPVAELPTDPAPAADPVSDEVAPDPRAAFAAAAAGQITAVIASWNTDLAAAGRASIPLPLIEHVFKPACERVIVRFAPASFGGPTTDLIIVAGVGGYSWQAHAALRKPAKPASAPQEPPSAPAGASTRPAPPSTPQEPPSAPQEPPSASREPLGAMFGS